jgi:hypothetical protein
VRKHKKAKPATFEILADGKAPRVRVRAATWRHLLHGAASAMAQLLREADAAAHPGALPPAAAPAMLSIELHRIDFDAMLVAWLNEILHLGRKHAMIFDSFDILQLDLEADCKLTAMIEGTLVSPERAQALHSVGSPTPRIRNIAKHMECEIRFQTAPS